MIVTTYEWPEALDVVLHALSEERPSDLEVVVADDGSSSATGRVVERWAERYGPRLRHVWQPNEGWRKARVLLLHLWHPPRISPVNRARVRESRAALT